MNRKTSRSYISTSGSFVSIPSAFPAADPGLKNAIKFEFKTIYSENSSQDLNLETVFSPNRFLVDPVGADPAAFDARKIAADCDFVKRLVAENPQTARRLLEIFHDDNPDIDEAFALVKSAGLTEEAAVKAGGGFIGLIVLLIVVAAAAGCAHTKPYKKPDPNPAK